MTTSVTRRFTAATLSGAYRKIAGASWFSVSIARRHTRFAASRRGAAVASSTSRSNTGLAERPALEGPADVLPSAMDEDGEGPVPPAVTAAAHRPDSVPCADTRV